MSAAFRRRLPALALIAVALAQIALALGAQLSPWLGGGFGMFASTDGWGRREIQVVAVREGLRRTLDATQVAPVVAQRAAALPTDGHLRALAREVAALPSPDEAPLRAVEIRVWGLKFERETLAPHRVLLRALSVPADAL